MSDSLSKIHEELSLEGHMSVHGICFMPFVADLFMASNNLSISQFCMSIRHSLFPYHHLPLIAKIDSKPKQFRLMFRTAKIDGKSKQCGLMFRTAKIDSKSKQIYDSKNNFA